MWPIGRPTRGIEASTACARREPVRSARERSAAPVAPVENVENRLSTARAPVAADENRLSTARVVAPPRGRRREPVVDDGGRRACRGVRSLAGQAVAFGNDANEDDAKIPHSADYVDGDDSCFRTTTGCRRRET